MPDGFPAGELLSKVPGIESGDLALDLILHDMAERARQRTGATGAAIALERGGALVCRAAAGSTVPDLGVEVNVQAGLSGACVRERKLQWCADTESDSRVDAAASRSLGVRSIVVLPLIASGSLLGVFELFSARPNAFQDCDIRTLEEMGQWVTEAVLASVAPENAPGPEPVIVLPEPVVMAPPAPETASVQDSVQILERRDRTTRILRGVAAVLAIVLCLLLGFRWGRGKGAGSGPQTTPVVQTVGQESAGLANGDAAEAALDTSSAKPKPPSGRTKSLTNNAALIARDNTGLTISHVPAARDEDSSRPEQQLSRPSASSTGSEARAATTQQKTGGETGPPVPAKELAGIGFAPLRSMPNVFAASVSPPSVKVPEQNVSKGVEEGRLIHSVQPKYPPDAMHRRIEGLVVLHALIGKDGSLRQLKSVRGDSLLVQAAVDAVRQWRYEPYKLNGVPVDMPIDITINFNLPK